MGKLNNHSLLVKAGVVRQHISAHSHSPSDFVNEALLEHTRYSFTVVRGCFGTTVAELSSCKKKLYNSQNLKYLPPDPLWEKFAESWVRERK